MSLLAVIPVKKLAQAKSRLAGEVSQQQRQLLAFHLLQRTIDELKSAAGVADILLVSRDEQVKCLAEKDKVLFLSEAGTSLNQALEQATGWAQEQRFAAVLILPLDIPFVSRDDIEALIEMADGENRVVVIAPDQKMRGTNALLVKPPGIINYRFGEASFVAHRQLARERKIESKVYMSARVGFDLDSPAQYRRAIKEGLSGCDLCRRT